MGSVAQFVLSGGTTGTSDQIRWAWGLGVTFGVYVAGGITGGHLNPAVTFTLCLFNRVPWSRLLVYCTAQYLGAFFASCLVYLVYSDAFSAYNGGNYTLETAGIFATYPQDYLSVANGLGDQIFGTAVLMFLVMALTDDGNMAPAKGYLPLLIGLVVVTIGMTFGHNCGYAINPARDLAPRFFTFIAGWGSQVISVNDYKWFWIPVVGPHVGAVIGGALYVGCINQKIACCGNHSEKTESKKPDASQASPRDNQSADEKSPNLGMRNRSHGDDNAPQGDYDVLQSGYENRTYSTCF